MSCNCGNISNCTQCSAGQPCNCPPDYSVLPQPVVCGCCPDGFTYIGVTPNFPNGACQCNATNPTCLSPGYLIASIACNDCVESVGADCVFVTNIPCLGITTTPVALSTVLQYFCSDAHIATILQKIGLNPALGSGLCQLVRNCPPSGSTTPIPGPIVVTIP